MSSSLWEMQILRVPYQTHWIRSSEKWGPPVFCKPSRYMLKFQKHGSGGNYFERFGQPGSRELGRADFRKHRKSVEAEKRGNYFLLGDSQAITTARGETLSLVP